MNPSSEDSGSYPDEGSSGSDSGPSDSESKGNPDDKMNHVTFEMNLTS